jgi:hypothetical protein
MYIIKLLSNAAFTIVLGGPSSCQFFLTMDFSLYGAILSYEAPYLGSEGGRSGRPTQAVRHTCPGNLRIVDILRFIRSDMYMGVGMSLYKPGVIEYNQGQIVTFCCP